MTLHGIVNLVTNRLDRLLDKLGKMGVIFAIIPTRTIFEAEILF